MTDELMDDLSDEEHAYLISISEHAIAPPLSPAACSVLRAAREAFDEWDLTAPVAAGLRAAALYCKRDRLQLLAIADELDSL